MERHTAPTGQRSGILVTTPYDSDKVTQSDTVQCCHCGATWVFIPGSGKTRGRCFLCNGFTCGPACPAGTGCVPQDRYLQNMEEGRPDDYRPVVVSTAGLILPG
ncbi:MAG: hypothetical protein V4597_11615 [Pseudomonadota bacterium]